MRFSADGQFLVTAGRDHTARVWEVETGKMLTELRGHTDWVTDADFSSDHRLVVTAGQDKSVRVWNTADGRQIAQFRDATGQVWAVAFSPDQRYIVSASADGFARIYPPEMFAPFDRLCDLARKRETRKLTSAEVQTYLPLEARQ
jgi:WD40 repeat protein